MRPYLYVCIAAALVISGSALLTQLSTPKAVASQPAYMPVATVGDVFSRF